MRSMACGFFYEVFGDSCEESGGFGGVKVRDSGSKMRIPGRYYEVFGEPLLQVGDRPDSNYEVFGEMAYGAQQAARSRLERRFLVLPAGRAPRNYEKFGVSNRNYEVFGARCILQMTALAR